MNEFTIKRDKSLILPKSRKKYRTIEAVMASMMGIKIRELKKYKIGGSDIDGNTSEMSVEAVKCGIEKYGVWGYVDEDTVLHYWAAKDVEMQHLIMFFSHEIGHLNGRKYKDINKEEEKAHEYSLVALAGYNYARKEK